MNADGFLDLAATVNSDVLVLLSTGPRSFAPPIVVATATNLAGAGIQAGDFDLDGDQDLAYISNTDATATSTNAISILANTGVGNFTPGGSFPVLVNPNPGAFSLFTTFLATDLNADGALDIAVTTTSGGLAPGTCYLSIALNTTAPGSPISFATAVNLNTKQGTAFAIESGDLDNNGTTDIIMSHAPDNSISVFLNAGSGTAGTLDATALSGSNDFGERPLALGDMNNDGFLDVLFLTPGQVQSKANQVKVLLNLDGGTKPQKAGQFKESTEFPVGQQPAPFVATTILFADLDADGVKDITTSFTNSIDGNLELLLTGSQPRSISAGTGHFDVIAEDLDGDGFVDLASVDGSGGTLSILWNRGPELGHLRVPHPTAH